MLPVEGDVASFGEIIAGASWNDTQCCVVGGAHDAVDRFMNAAITAGHHHSFHALIHVLQHLSFKISG